MMAALAYIPVRDVKSAYRALVLEAPKLPRIDEFNLYFDKTYINGVPGAGRRPRVPPRYEPDTWNIYQVTLDGRAATNNASGGWHNRFRQLVERKHPDLYTLLHELKKEQGDTEVGILELRMGRRIKAAPKKKWLEIHQRVRTTLKGYPAFGVARIIEFLKLVSYNITFE